MLFALYLQLYQSRAQDRWDGREALSQPPHTPGEAPAPELICLFNFIISDMSIMRIGESSSLVVSQNFIYTI